MLTNVLLVIVGLVIIWLGVITYLVYKTYSHYNKLIKFGDSADLKKVLEKVLELEDQNRKGLKQVIGKVTELEKDGYSHIQKLGLVKYNPFNDTGGDHSFSLAALDAHKNGFVLTGLHTRDKTRFYVKSIKLGAGNKELSEEERRAIEIAVKS